QVGSFGDAANAQRLGSQLTGEGFSVFQRQRDNNLTTVLVGPYASSEDGEAAMALIKQRANVQGLLVRVRD
ncbi:MAG: SPOR domain-containing protein, partial [Halomonas sp.]